MWSCACPAELLLMPTATLCSMRAAGPHPTPTACSTHNSKLYWDQPEHYLPERWLVPGCECATPGGVAKAQAVSDSAGAHGGQGFAAKGKGGVHVVATPGVAAAPAEEAGEGNSARPVRFLPFSVVRWGREEGSAATGGNGAVHARRVLDRQPVGKAKSAGPW